MLRLDPATTSGSAVAFLFRTWCFLRGAGPGRRPEAAELAYAVEDMAVGHGLDPAGPPAQVELAGTGEVFTVFGLRYDRADVLLMVGVIRASMPMPLLNWTATSSTSPVGRHRPR